MPAAAPAALEELRDQAILITGAGGSIGSALARELTHLNPRKLILLDTSENNLHHLGQQLQPSGRITIVLGDVTDEALLEDLFQSAQPDLVFHAAAHKHVSLLEDHPLAAIQNNVFGTLALTRKAQSHNSRIILVSTDKAAAPSSIMGATKNIAERIVLAHNGSAIRLGNVLGSRGSVVETFIEQIARRQPLTISDPNARRYFLTLAESVHLLLTVSLTQQPGLQIADLTETSGIVDLAIFIAKHLAPAWQPLFTYTGLRPGEKLTESLCAANEQPALESEQGLRRVDPSALPQSKLELALRDLSVVTANRDIQAAIDILTDLIPSYQPSSKIQSLRSASQPRAVIR